MKLEFFFLPFNHCFGIELCSRQNESRQWLLFVFEMGRFRNKSHSHFHDWTLIQLKSSETNLSFNNESGNKTKTKSFHECFRRLLQLRLLLVIRSCRLKHSDKALLLEMWQQKTFEKTKILQVVDSGSFCQTHFNNSHKHGRISTNSITDPTQKLSIVLNSSVMDFFFIFRKEIEMSKHFLASSGDCLIRKYSRLNWMKMTKHFKMAFCDLWMPHKNYKNITSKLCEVIE